MKQNIIFTIGSLDGLASALVLHWVLPGGATIVHTFSEKAYSTITANCKTGKYDNIYILNLGNSSLKAAFPKAKYFDFSSNVNRAKSCTQLTYDILNINYIFSSDQKHFVELVNDYTVYNCIDPDSLNLNILFFSYKTERYKLFVERFKNGFDGFNDHERELFRLERLKLEDIKQNLMFYTAKLNIQNETVKVVSVEADSFINEIAQYSLNRTSANIVFVINKMFSVSLRKHKDCKVDLVLLAQKLLDGGGHASAASGKLTDKYLKFSKILKHEIN